MASENISRGLQPMKPICSDEFTVSTFVRWGDSFVTEMLIVIRASDFLSAYRLASLGDTRLV